MKTRKEFRVGDKVFCFGFGQGIVKKVSECDDAYPIFVKFEERDGNYKTCYFTSDGKRYDVEKDVCSMVNCLSSLLNGSK